MTIKEKVRAKLVIWKVALAANKSPAEVRKEMQAAIDLAWQTTTPATLEAQHHRFPAGKPTVEEFMIELGKQLKNMQAK